MLPNGHKYKLENIIIISYKLFLYTFVRSIYILKQWKYFKAMELDTFFFFLSIRLQGSDGQYFGGSTKAGFAKLNKFNVAA